MYSILATVLIGLFVMSSTSHAQNPSAFFEEVNNSGREFFLTFPPCIEETETSDSNTCVLFIFGDKDQEVTVEVASKGYSETRFLRAFEVEKWELSPDIAQVYRHFDDTDIVADSLFAGAAVHVLAEHRVVVNVETRFGKRRASYIAKPADAAYCSSLEVPFYLEVPATRDSTLERTLPSSVSIVGVDDDTNLHLQFQYFVKEDNNVDSVVNLSKLVHLNKGDVLHLNSIEGKGYVPSFKTYRSSHHSSAALAYVVASSYGVLPGDSSEFDFAMSSVENNQLVDVIPFTASSAFQANTHTMHFTSRDSIPQLADFLFKRRPYSYVYQCPVEAWNSVVTPPGEGQLTVSGVAVHHFDNEPSFRYSYNVEHYRSRLQSSSSFYISELHGSTHRIELLVRTTEIDDTTTNIYQYDTITSKWNLFRSILREELEQPVGELAMASVSFQLPIGLYLVQGKHHALYHENGLSLVHPEDRGGCAAHMYSNTYQQIGHNIEGEVGFGCNILSRIFISSKSKNCELEILHHDYQYGNITYRLTPIDSTQPCTAYMIAKPLNGAHGESAISWKPNATNVEDSPQGIRIGISPHPAEDGSVLAIESERSQPAKISFFDSQGALHTQIEQQLGSSTSIPLLDNLASGLWLVVVETATGRYETTFVKH